MLQDVSCQLEPERGQAPQRDRHLADGRIGDLADGVSPLFRCASGAQRASAKVHSAPTEGIGRPMVPTLRRRTARGASKSLEGAGSSGESLEDEAAGEHKP